MTSYILEHVSIRHLLPQSYVKDAFFSLIGCYIVKKIGSTILHGWHIHRGVWHYLACLWKCGPFCSIFKATVKNYSQNVTSNSYHAMCNCFRSFIWHFVVDMYKSNFYLQGFYQFCQQGPKQAFLSKTLHIVKCK